MSKVVRFFHLRSGPKGGGTVRVTGDLDIVGQVDVQFAKCSKRDSFVKKVGRAEAEKAPIKVVPLRYLPRELARLERTARAWTVSDFDFATKYFLPKE